MVYEYSWNGPNRSVEAWKVAEHLQKLEQENGGVTREAFLESARDENSEMHKLFEWDDTVAAEKYRLEQANKIIHSIQVTVVEEEEKPPVKLNLFTMPGYTEKKVGDTGRYINVMTATAKPDTRALILEDARKNAKWFMNKYQSITELAEVISAIENFLDKTA